MAQSSKLRKEIEALRNQAKAMGVENKELGVFKIDPVAKNITHKYIKRDILKTIVFVLIVILVLLIIAIKLSNIEIFEFIRNNYKIPYILP